MPEPATEHVLMLRSFGFLHLPKDAAGRPIPPTADRIEDVRDRLRDPAAARDILDLDGLEEDGTRRTPDLDDCRPNCVNIARTDRDIEQVHVQIERLRPLVDDPLAPAFRHAREQHELDRLERIVTAHDHTGEPHDGH